jgi:hypothetical protein
LSEAESNQLTDIIKRGEYSRRERQREQMLVWSASGKTDLKIGALLALNPFTVAKTREHWVKERRIAAPTSAQETGWRCAACVKHPSRSTSWRSSCPTLLSAFVTMAAPKRYR